MPAIVRDASLSSRSAAIERTLRRKEAMRNHNSNGQNNLESLVRKGSHTIIRVRSALGKPPLHIALHRLIGGLIISLPLVLTIKNFISAGTPPPGSLSGYYYTDMRSLFVGGLCALGAFLLAYRGYARLDALITDSAGISMIMVALCPTRPLTSVSHLTAQENAVGDIHDVFAIIAPLALGVTALRFARARRQPEVTIHRACAAIIFSCVLFAIMSSHVFRSINDNPRAVLMCEVLAMIASGTSWLASRRVHSFPALDHTMTPTLRKPTHTIMPSMVSTRRRTISIAVRGRP